MKKLLFLIIMTLFMTSCGTTEFVVHDEIYVPNTTVIYKTNSVPWIYAPHKYMYFGSKYDWYRHYNRSFLTKPYKPGRPSAKPHKQKPHKPNPHKPNPTRRPSNNRRR